MADATAQAPSRFGELVLDFLAHLELERGMARNTLQSYRSDLLQFGVFLDARGQRLAIADPATPAGTAPGGTPCRQDAALRQHRRIPERVLRLSRRRSARTGQRLFTAMTGTTTAIIGATGSGKTTLLNLLPRFLDPTTGGISIGGRNVRGMPLEALRDLIKLSRSNPISSRARSRITSGSARPQRTSPNCGRRSGPPMPLTLSAPCLDRKRP